MWSLNPRGAIKEAKVLNTLHVVQDGVEALAFLHKQGKYASLPSPDLILLDLNLPRKDGREVLAEIKEDERPEAHSGSGPHHLQSRRGRDPLLQFACQRLCHQAGGFDAVSRSDPTIEAFWLAVVTLPPRKKAEADGA